MTDKPRCRILVVEDEAMIAMLVEEMVLDFGSEVVGPGPRRPSEIPPRAEKRLSSRSLMTRLLRGVRLDRCHVVDAAMDHRRQDESGLRRLH
jgi:CheY-like chemotaxis protein